MKITKFNEIEALLKQIKEFLQIKREQVRLLLEFISVRQNVKVITGRGYRGATSFGEREEKIYLKLNELNKRGGPGV